MNILHFTLHPHAFIQLTSVNLLSVFEVLHFTSLQQWYSMKRQHLAIMKMCLCPGVVEKSPNQMDFLTRISIAATWLAQISVRDLQMTYLFIFMMTEALTSV